MPHEIMNDLHETGLDGSYHWLFWIVTIVVIAVAVFFLLRFGLSKYK